MTSSAKDDGRWTSSFLLLCTPSHSLSAMAASTNDSDTKPITRDDDAAFVARLRRQSGLSEPPPPGSSRTSPVPPGTKTGRNSHYLRSARDSTGYLEIRCI